MNEPPPSDAAGRLIACRECGNRVQRSARRCPGCGALEPTSAVAPPRPAESTPASAPPRGRWRWPLALIGAALGGAAATAGLFELRSAAPPPVIERRPEAPAPPAAPANTVPSPESPAPSRAPGVSRSRGRTDWLFFFKTGDRLVRMSDEAPIGMVLRTVPKHEFADGTVGPAYLMQVPEGGGQRFVDADELERGGRLQ